MTLKPEDIESMAREAGWTGIYAPFTPQRVTVPVTPEQVANFAALAYAHGVEDAARAAEGEALTEPTEQADDFAYDLAVRDCAVAIRALLKPKP